MSLTNQPADELGLKISGGGGSASTPAQNGTNITVPTGDILVQPPTAAAIDAWRAANVPEDDQSADDILIYVDPDGVRYSYAADDTGNVTLVAQHNPNAVGGYVTINVDTTPQALVSHEEPTTIHEYVVTATAPLVAIPGTTVFGVELTLANPIAQTDKIDVVRQSVANVWINGSTNGDPDGTYINLNHRSIELRAKSDLSGWFMSVGGNG